MEVQTRWSNTNLAHMDNINVSAGSLGQNQTPQHLTDDNLGEFQPCLLRAENTMQLPIGFVNHS